MAKDKKLVEAITAMEDDFAQWYILSCHGNQGQYILDHYKEFQSYVRKKTEGGFHITKDAGIFVGYNG